VLDTTKILIDGGILSLAASLVIAISMLINPRLWLQDYPQEIQDSVPPKTDREKRLSLIVGVPFLLVMAGVALWSTWRLQAANQGGLSFLLLSIHAFGVVFIFNLFDWLILDWLLFCTITPSWMVIPGTEGMAAYQDYFFHFRGFLVGIGFSAVTGPLIAAVVAVLG